MNNHSDFPLADNYIYTVLLTGANAGLGYATCCRLIDEFLATRPNEQSLHLLFTTRDKRKNDDTLKSLNQHLEKTLSQSYRSNESLRTAQRNRIRLEGEQLDLLSLISVKALAKRLVQRQLHIDVVILNAGVGGWKGWNWPVAIWGVLTNMPASVTWPTYKLGYVGRVTKPQLPSSGQGLGTNNYGSKSIAESTTQETEPALGETFTANVFGHYMLVHQLSPLLSSRTTHDDSAQRSRIIWVSSIEAYAHSFNLTDLQGLQDQTSYESSKRLTDLLVLTSPLPSTQRHVTSFLPPPPDPDALPPTQYLCHPGICATSIAGLPYLLKLSMIATFYIARLLQSPWHTIAPYLGAVSVVWLALSPEPYLLSLESEAENASHPPDNQHSTWSTAPGMNKSKWGSSTDISGGERVIRTEVEGWGWSGVVGQTPDGGMRISGGREPGAKILGQEDREGFEELGARAWGAMEELRTEWMERLEGLESD
ncbi:hypothetical protein MBLNU457_g1111t1 [Dothideomycetes sp. NU457]